MKSYKEKWEVVEFFNSGGPVDDFSKANIVMCNCLGRNGGWSSPFTKKRLQKMVGKLSIGDRFECVHSFVKVK